jgi:hypothetical protein
MSIDTAVMTESTHTADAEAYPEPPSLHWALVILFNVLTKGTFVTIWVFFQAAWVRRIDPSSKALVVLAVALACAVPPIVLVGESELTLTLWLVGLGYTGAFIWAYFSMRQSIEARFDLNLSGLMTLVFSVFYLQYHMTRIAKGEHTPERHGLFS